MSGAALLDDRAQDFVDGAEHVGGDSENRPQAAYRRSMLATLPIVAQALTATKATFGRHSSLYGAPTVAADVVRGKLRVDVHPTLTPGNPGAHQRG